VIDLARYFFFVVVLICVSIFISINCVGQTPERFEGKWVIDPTANASSKFKYDYYDLTLSFDGDKLTVTKDFGYSGKKFKYTQVLFTNNKGERNLLPEVRDNVKEVESKTRWKDGAIVRKFSVQTGMGLPSSPTLNLYQIQNTIEKYSVSDDGKHLNLKIDVTGEMYNNSMAAKSMGNLNSSTKLVFQRN
jgi:hypothetical protein